MRWHPTLGQVAFGEQLDPTVLAAAGEAAAACDLFLAVGTSLTVMPAAGLCGLAHRSGAELVIVNAEPTPYDDIASAVLRDPIDEVLPAIAAGASRAPDLARRGRRRPRTP